jgi:spore coat polysaccharide biosynthesis protein SpsF
MILALLQARTSSTRLPGKVLKPILGKAMILHQIDRIRRSQRIDKLVLVTSDVASDDRLADTCSAYGVSVFRGSLNDVLDRFYQAAQTENPDHIVRLTGDCPLTDPSIIDRVIEFHLGGGFDYTSNVSPPTFADGLDTEILRHDLLVEAWKEARTARQREHVTLWMNQSENIKRGNLENFRDESAMRWTVDEPEDLQLVKAIYAALYPAKPDFNARDIADFLDGNNSVRHINSGFERNAEMPRLEP